MTLAPLPTFFMEVDEHTDIQNDSEHWLSCALDEMGRRPLLSFSQEQALAVQIQAGNKQAREQMILANLGLVIHFARRAQEHGLPLADLVQEGAIGLMHAVEKFDPELGYRFSTYASLWIRQSINRAITNQSRIIRLPAHIEEMEVRLRRACDQLIQLLGRDPTDKELAHYTNLKIEQIEQFQQMRHPLLRLGNPGCENEKWTQGDSLLELPDPTADDPADYIERQAHQQNLKQQIEEMFTHLSKRECQVLILRFGLFGHTSHTLKEIGKVLHLTQERVRQIEQEALQKLRPFPLNI